MQNDNQNQNQNQKPKWMLKAIHKDAFKITERWEIVFCGPSDNKWEWYGNFVGNIYRSGTLRDAGYLDAYEFYYYDSTTPEIVQMLFINQLELMKFLSHIGNELRAKAKAKERL